MENKNVFTQLINVIFCTLIYSSCTQYGCDTIPTPYVESLIKYYINEESGPYLDSKTHIIKVIFYENSERYAIDIIGYNKDMMVETDTSFFGFCSILNYDIYFYGDTIKDFIEELVTRNSNNKIETKSKISADVIYDPTVYHISLFKNFEFDEMNSYKASLIEDISTLKELTNKYLEVDHNIEISRDSCEVFRDVEKVAGSSFGLDSLQSEIKQCFKRMHPKIKDMKDCIIVIEITVDKIGVILNPRVIRNDCNVNIDSDDLEFITEINHMYSAIHRGKRVNSYYSIPIKF